MTQHSFLLEVDGSEAAPFLSFNMRRFHVEFELLTFVHRLRVFAVRDAVHVVMTVSTVGVVYVMR